MKRLDLPRYVYRITDRYGTTRRYFRRNGLNRLMPATSTDGEEFQAAYQKALADSYVPKEPRKPQATLSYPAGSFGHLCESYERSAQFKGLAESTRREMGYVIRKLVKARALQPVVAIRRSHVFKLQDELADKPGTANNALRTMKRLMAFAVDRDFRPDNPTLRMRELKGGEHRPWTPDEHERFKARWPMGTMERRAYALALFTGQRKMSLAKMRVPDRAHGIINVEPAKRGPRLEIPEHPELTRELDAMKPPGVNLLWKRDGRQISQGHFGSMMSDAIHAALDVRDADGNVERTKCVFHGLRKSAGARLADAGCTPHQIQAILGHLTLRMAAHYTKGADQKRLAKAAILKLRRSK